MSSRKISGSDAWKSLVEGSHARWAKNIERFRKPAALVTHEPKFKIAPEDTFFCIGSCFARNIEEHLIYAGMRVLSKNIISPMDEWPHRVNGFVNKFTTHSMLNEVEWATHPPKIDETLFDETPKGWTDLQLCPGVKPVSLERAIERRTYLVNDYFPRLGKASVVVLTLGLNEAWWDSYSGRYLNAAPAAASTRRDPARYSLDVTGVDENVTALEAIYAQLQRLNPSLRMIVTVSPVPMGQTFSGTDVVVANTLSKSTLRVAADTFARHHPNVDYFPTYDMITSAPRDLTYGADCIHVTDLTVQTVIGYFLSLYIGREIEPAAFSEVAYLAANRDVEAAVRRGEYDSGFHHWIERGEREGYPLRPESGPTRMMVRLGVV